MITAKGIQPICPYQHKFENSYLFGAFAPISGDSLLLELPFCNSDMFELFLKELSKQKPHELKIIILDNGAFHKAKRLQIPDNIALVFLPPYSPELNPAELVWKFIKSKITNISFSTLTDLSTSLQEIIRQNINKETIKSITSFPFYLNVIDHL